MNAICFDVESYSIDGAADYIEPATPPANYKDPNAILNYVVKANADALAKAALDVDLARIVAIGYSVGDVPVAQIARDETEERDLLEKFWRKVATNPRPTLIGYNCINFDLPLLLRRSLYLGVSAPRLQMGKYRHDGIEDLLLRLSFDGALKYRSLSFYAKRLALDVPKDQHNGADIAGLVAAGNYDAVADHCRSDVATTQALAKRLGVL